jgi:DNA-binding transcriptional ArsR family regulator
MVDEVFRALSSESRRQMLRRLASRPLLVTELARHFELTLAGVSKHLQVLEAAGLISQKREGRLQWCHFQPRGIRGAGAFLEELGAISARRVDGLQSYLSLYRKRATPAATAPTASRNQKKTR